MQKEKSKSRNDNADAPKCVCGATMVIRHRTSDGQPFWGCPNWKSGGKHSTFPIDAKDNQPHRPSNKMLNKKILSFEEFLVECSENAKKDSHTYTVKGDLLDGFHGKNWGEPLEAHFTLMDHHNVYKKMKVIMWPGTIIKIAGTYDGKPFKVQKGMRLSLKELMKNLSDTCVVITGNLGFYRNRASSCLWAHQITVVSDSSAKRERKEAEDKYDCYFKKAEEQKKFKLDAVTDIAVITGGTPEKPCHGAEDFVNKLYKHEGPKVTKYEYVNINHGEEVAEKLKELDATGRYRAICIVRGGGDPEALVSFSSPALLEAIIEAHAAIITGVGHSDDDLLCDRVADYNGGTPAGAANYLNKEINRIRKEEWIRQNSRSIAKADQAAAIAKQDIDYLQTQIEELQGENSRLKAKLEAAQQQEEKKGFFRRLFHL